MPKWANRLRGCQLRQSVNDARAPGSLGMRDRCAMTTIRWMYLAYWNPLPGIGWATRLGVRTTLRTCQAWQIAGDKLWWKLGKIELRVWAINWTVSSTALCWVLSARCWVLGAYVRRSSFAMPEDRIQNEPYGVSESNPVSGSVLLLVFFFLYSSLLFCCTSLSHCCFWLIVSSAPSFCTWNPNCAIPKINAHTSQFCWGLCECIFGAVVDFFTKVPLHA